MVWFEDRLWTVREDLDPPHLGGQPVLLCYSDTSARRIHDFPSNWFELSHAELAKLCGGR